MLHFRERKDEQSKLHKEREDQYNIHYHERFKSQTSPWKHEDNPRSKLMIPDEGELGDDDFEFPTVNVFGDQYHILEDIFLKGESNHKSQDPFLRDDVSNKNSTNSHGSVLSKFSTGANTTTNT